MPRHCPIAAHRQARQALIVVFPVRGCLRLSAGFYRAVGIAGPENAALRGMGETAAPREAGTALFSFQALINNAM